jgi:hypothetical protein
MAMTAMMNARKTGTIALIAGGLCLWAGAADAQLLGGGVGSAVGGVTGTLGRTTQGLTSTVDHTVNSVEAKVTDAVGRPKVPVRNFEQDLSGDRVVRGTVLAIAPSAQGLAVARNLNFAIARQETMPSLGLDVAVLTVPDGMSVTDALAALRKADPSGSYDYDHLYDPSGGQVSASSGDDAGRSASAATKIGMIDAGVDRNHPAFGDAKIVAKNFASGKESPGTAHGTAVASLLVGSDGDFRGALAGATLYAADVYGGEADGGSAEDIARALAWLAANNVPVANVSLAGPKNALLGAAVAAFLSRGHVLVAAVGNDGPAAPAKYPAGFSGVVGVTSVDAARNIQLDAGQGADVMFAARGVDVRVAGAKGHYVSMTGTSFASPLVAARLALDVPRADAQIAARAIAALQHSAIDLGAPGRDPVFGYGFLDALGTVARTAKAQQNL